jgi:hypothetical protein
MMRASIHPGRLGVNNFPDFPAENEKGLYVLLVAQVVLHGTDMRN